MRIVLASSSFGMVTIAVLAWLLCTTVITASSSYNAYNYDMTTPMFTPDGRLLQVEYACRAACHSSPLICAKVANDDSIVVMVSKSSRRRHCGQDRLVVFGDNNSCSGSCVVIAMSGVLSDSIRLLRIVQEESERELRRYGTTLSCQQIATIIGDSCQLHAFGGGMRPYGSTMIVCDSCNVWQTDPSGAVVALRGAMVGEKEKDDTAVISVVGGTDTMQAKLQKDIILKKDMDLPKTLVAMAKVLLQTDKEEIETKHQNDEWLEVVVLSPSHGVHRLTDTQIQSLIQATKEQLPKK